MIEITIRGESLEDCLRQISAEPKAKAAAKKSEPKPAPAPVPAPVPENVSEPAPEPAPEAKAEPQAKTPSIEDVRVVMLKLNELPDGRKKVQAIFKKYGVKNLTTLPKEQYEWAIEDAKKELANA